jgi:hypothetical protein
MMCSKCGRGNLPNARFCEECGERVEGAGSLPVIRIGRSPESDFVVTQEDVSWNHAVIRTTRGEHNEWDRHPYAR